MNMNILVQEFFLNYFIIDHHIIIINKASTKTICIFLKSYNLQDYSILGQKETIILGGYIFWHASLSFLFFTTISFLCCTTTRV